MISFSFPQWEIHNSKDPIALIIYPSRKMIAYKLKPLGGKYFVIKDGRKFEGIFELDPTKSYHFGKTPMYVFDSRNCLPIDGVIVNELSKFSKKNRLGKIERKEIEQGGVLRELLKKIPKLEDAINVLLDKTKQRKEKIKKVVSDIGNPENIPTNELGYILTNYLVQNDLLSPEEKGKLDHELTIGKIDYNELIALLKVRDIVTVNTPIELNVQMFLDDFGGYNPEQLASFVDRLRRDEKGLRNMTSTPVKNWIPAGVIMALLIGGAIAFMIVLQSTGQIGDMFSGMMPGGAPVVVEPTPEPITNGIEFTPDVEDLTPAIEDIPTDTTPENPNP
jgi:hypothetical protein